MRDIVDLSVLEFLRLAVVPVLNGAVVAGDTAVDFGLSSAYRAGVLFAAQISVILAYRIGRGQRVVRKLIVVRDLLDESRRRLPVGELFAEERVEYGARGVQRLKFVLNVESVEDIRRIADGQVRAVGVVRGAVFVSGDDIGELLLVVLSETVRGGLCRRSFEVIQIAVFFLIVGQSFTHMVEYLFGEFLSGFVCHILAYPVRVESRFVHTDETYRREVVGESAQITLGVRIQTFVEKLCYDNTLCLERTRRNIHKSVKAFEEIVLVL